MSALDSPAGRTAPPARDVDFVQSLARGLAVIRAFGPGRDRLSLSDVARATGLTRSVARRCLLTLASLGYVRTEGRLFSLRPRVLELGYVWASSLGLADLARPHLEQLVAALAESSSVALLDGQDIVYIARVPARRIVTAAITVGTRLPAHATALGRVLLAGMAEDELARWLARASLEPRTGRTLTRASRLRAELAKVARQGYAIVDQELEEGLLAVAVPIRGAAGSATAAVNISADASRVSVGQLQARCLPALREAATLIEDDMRATVGRAAGLTTTGGSRGPDHHLHDLGRVCDRETDR
ncbi:MAG TPA: IclR family transcriptional regulator C-terminal domain-containing protein [Streptosporangiaceae bacterium]|nr:IclR family transcriptional regulator C-terminal domain-containing protein [Streptosporangiaceae bacterium]